MVEISSTLVHLEARVALWRSIFYEEVAKGTLANAGEILGSCSP